MAYQLGEHANPWIRKNRHPQNQKVEQDFYRENKKVQTKLGIKCTRIDWISQQKYVFA